MAIQRPTNFIPTSTSQSCSNRSADSPKLQSRSYSSCQLTSPFESPKPHPNL